MTTALIAQPQHDCQHLREIIRAEFNEMPDMHLTRAQVKRLWTLSDEQCDECLADLVRSGFLAQGRGDFYRRAEDRA